MKQIFLLGFITYIVSIVLYSKGIIPVVEYGEFAAVGLIIVSMGIYLKRSRMYLPAFIMSIINALLLGVVYYLKYYGFYIGNSETNLWDYAYFFSKVICYTIFIYFFIHANIKFQRKEKNITRFKRTWGYTLGFTIASTFLILSIMMICHVSGIWDLEVLSRYFSKDTWSTFTPVILSGGVTILLLFLSQVKLFFTIFKSDTPPKRLR